MAVLLTLLPLQPLRAQTLNPAQPGTNGQVRLPALGESASETFSVSTEKRLGEQIIGEIRRDPAYLDDPVLQEYLQWIWRRLVAAAHARGDIEGDIDQQFAWQSFLVRDKTVNAFALPGGYVGVNLGLIALTTTSDELASVLAHELSHVTQRHIARTVVNGQHTSMLSLAAILLGIIAGARAGNPDVANAAIVGGQAAQVQGQLNFSRDMEREADRNGFGILGAAGFATSGMAQMFDKLDSANRLNDNGSYPYLRSHPLTVQRISEARSRTLFGGGGTPSPPLRHALMQMRAKVLMDTDPQTLHRLAERALGLPDASLRDRLAALYAGALSASLLREHTLAERLADAAQTLARSASPREPQAERELQLLQAELALNRADAAAATADLDSISVDAHTRAPLLMRAQAALAAQQEGRPQAATALRQSTEALQTWLAEHPGDASAWTLLSSTAGAIGLRLRSLRAGAEARAAVGDLRGAIDRLRSAQLAARGRDEQDFIEASVIDARLRELQGQRRQLEIEARGNHVPGDDD